jgi:glycosyltransferase involved in cell wall biosynthesis
MRADRLTAKGDTLAKFKIKVGVSCLQISKYYHPVEGGIERIVSILARGLEKRGANVAILCSGQDWKGSREVGKIQVTRSRSLGVFASTPITPFFLFNLLEQVNRYDVIHLHLPNPIASLCIAIARPRGKLVLHWHSDIVKQKWLVRVFNPIQEWVLSRADKIIATSPPYIESSPWLKRYRRKVQVIPCCVEDPIASVYKSEVNGKVNSIKSRFLGKKIIFSLGRMTYYKGFNILIEAAMHLGNDVVILIGGTGELLDSYVALAKRLNVVDKVVFLGRIPEEELHSYYMACDLFCLPSLVRSEAFGMVLLEAMAFSKPILATDIFGSGVPWVNVDAVTGKNVPPGDPVKLAAMAESILSQPEISRAMGRAGRKRFEEAFTAEFLVDSVEKLYDSL